MTLPRPLSPFMAKWFRKAKREQENLFYEVFVAPFFEKIDMGRSADAAERRRMRRVIREQRSAKK